jgi:hypothetical protein
MVFLISTVEKQGTLSYPYYLTMSLGIQAFMITSMIILINFTSPWKIHMNMNITLIKMGRIDTIQLQHLLLSQKNISLMQLSMLILMILLMTSWKFCIQVA